MFEQQFLPLFGDLELPAEYSSLSCALPKEVTAHIIEQQDRELETVEKLTTVFLVLDNPAVKKLEFFAFLEYAVVLCLGENFLFPFLKNCLVLN